MDFYEMLKNEIETQYGSVGHFASVIGVSRSVFTRLFSNGINNIGNKTLRKISIALDVVFEDLKIEKLTYREYTQNEIEKFEKEDKEHSRLVIDPLNPLEEDIIKALRELDFTGQYKVLEYAKDINPNYKRK